MSTCRLATTPPSQGSVTYVETDADGVIAQKLGLANFSLVFDFDSDANRWTIELTNFGAVGADPTVTLNADQSAIINVTGSQYTGNSALPIYAYQTGPLQFFLSTNQGATPNLTRGVTWFLSFDPLTDQIIARDSNCPLNVAPLPQLGEMNYESEGVSITIRAESSYDGLQLTLASITISTCGTEVFYNLPLPSVMNGPGCTLLSKSQMYPIALVVEYALLKFALAKLLFGCYSLCYLTQEWDALILKRLRVEYPSFYARLVSFVGYVELFIQSCA